MAWPADAFPLPLATDDPAVRLAAAEWTAHDAAFDPRAAAPIGPDGQIAVADLSLADWQAQVGDPALLGFTVITHVDGRLTDADVVLNADAYRFSDAIDPRAFHRPSTLRHELGHALGLGHSPTVAALMHAAQEPGQRAAITTGDVADLTAVSACCAARRAPDPAALAPDDRVWAHGAAVVPLPVRAAGAVDVPADTTHLEIWTSTGHGALFALTEDDAAPDAGPPIDAAIPPPARPTPGSGGADPGGCQQAPGSGPGLSWILAVSLCRRRRCWRRR